MLPLIWRTPLGAIIIPRLCGRAGLGYLGNWPGIFVSLVELPRIYLD
jgi:hypothetical protein